MIRLISAVPISIARSLVFARDALFHFLKLGAHAAVVNLAFQLDQQAAEKTWVRLLLQHDLFAGNSSKLLAQPLQHRRIKPGGANDFRLDSPLGLVEETPIAVDDAGQMSETVAL